MCCITIRRCAFVAIALTSAWNGILSSAHGQVFNWDNPAGGNYHSSLNWTPLGVPNTITESAVFKLAVTNNITLSSGVTTPVLDLLIRNGDYTFAADAQVFTTYTVDNLLDISGGNLALDQSGGGGDVRLTTEDLQVDAGNVFRVDAGARVTVNNSFKLGDAGSNTFGIMLVEGGSTLTVNPIVGVNFRIGANAFDPGGTSTLTVTGSGSSLNADFHASAIMIGDETAGVLEVPTVRR
jgi:hypothetical protein